MGSTMTRCDRKNCLNPLPIDYPRGAVLTTNLLSPHFSSRKQRNAIYIVLWQILVGLFHYYIVSFYLFSFHFYYFVFLHTKKFIADALNKFVIFSLILFFFTLISEIKTKRIVYLMYVHLKVYQWKRRIALSKMWNSSEMLIHLNWCPRSSFPLFLYLFFFVIFSSLFYFISSYFFFFFSFSLFFFFYLFSLRLGRSLPRERRARDSRRLCGRIWFAPRSTSFPIPYRETGLDSQFGPLVV